MVGVKQGNIPDVFRASYARLMQNIYINVVPHEAIRMPGLVRVSTDITREIKVECIDHSDSALSTVTAMLSGSVDTAIDTLSGLGHVWDRKGWRHKLLQVLDGERALKIIMLLVLTGILSLVCEQSFDS
jgi:hypothetical protein